MSNFRCLRTIPASMFVIAAISFPQANLAASYKTHGLNFGPFVDGQDPNLGSVVSEAQLRSRMSIIAPHTNWIRTFGATNGLQAAGRIAREFGLKVAMGAWISRNLTANQAEIANLIAAAQAGQVDLAIVGSETMLRSDVSEAQLIAYINQVRTQIPPGIPVTTADVYGQLQNRPNLIAAVDIVMANFYPYWEGYDINVAMAALHRSYLLLKTAAGSKPVYVSESGWPSGGNTVGSAVPNPNNAAVYFLNFVSWARANNVPYFYLEAFDETWKANYEGPQGAHWGVWDKNGILKQGIQRVFDGETVTNNWSGAPSPVSVSPASGTGAAQSFSFRFVDLHGFADIVSVQIDINSTLSASNACYVYYSRATDQIWLMSDSGTAWLGPVLVGSVANLSNGQCTISAGASTATGTGNDLILSLALTFHAAFAGAKKVYMFGYDAGGLSSGWQERGSWTVPAGSNVGTNQPPSAVSVNPSSGTGSTQTFLFEFSDPNGFTDLVSAQVNINATLVAAGACYLYYAPATGGIWLMNDAGTSWLGPATVRSDGRLSNSQCSLNAGLSTVSWSGNRLILVLALTFRHAFAGAKKIFMFGYDSGGLSSGWQERGSWAVIGNQPPSAVSVNPSSGSGTTQMFNFLLSDPNSFADLVSVQVNINSTLAASGACYLYYAHATNQIWLMNDAGSSWMGPLTVGAAGILSNSQCSLNAEFSLGINSVNHFQLNLYLTFKPVFAGAKKIFMFGYDAAGLSSGWQERGSWAVIGNQPPSAISVNPSSGTGTSQTFNFLFYDPNGFADFVSAQVDINSTLAASGACYLYYARATNQIWLMNDAGSSWIGPVTVGAAGGLSNSQCSLNAGSSYASALWNELRLSLALTFQPAFAGAKTTYMFGYDAGGLSSGWQERGTWTVP